MRQLIAGNWKMNGTRAEAAALAAGLAGAAADRDLLVCPPATVLAQVATALAGTKVAVGGQDCSADPPGAQTGCIAAAMLADAGATFVVLGHSERRQNQGETDELVRQKVLAAVKAGLTPIVCVGETEEQRFGGNETEVVGWQLSGSLPEGFAGIVAYEPIWAIGTGKSATAQDVEMMHAFIREELVRQFPETGPTTRILYGGSVKPGNAREILAVANVDGALVGGASLEIESFLAIARA